MSVRTMVKKLSRLEALARRRNDRNTVVLEALASDPVRILTDAGMEADSWQAGVLRSNASRLLLLASRQAGKSSVAAALALQTALLRPRSPVLLLSPSLRQSGELYRKIVDLFGALGRPMGVTAESALRLELANGSRVVSLPGDEKNIRGFSGVALLVIDEAARVADSLYYAVRPMLAVSRGRLVALSTPFGKRGWYHDEWFGEGAWERVKLTADQCPRISTEFLAEEPRALGERYTEIVPAVARLASSEPLRDSPLVVDQTGVGQPVVDMLRHAADSVVPVTITGGYSLTQMEDGSWHVPKKELVTSLQVLMQGRRLQIARRLPDAALLVRELQNFQVKITAAANETFGVWREGQHDDLVLAVALASWWGERNPPLYGSACSSGGESIFANAPEGVFLT